MARDNLHHHHHHTSAFASNTSSNSTSHGHSNTGGSGSNRSSSRRHRIPNPPVPHAQASLLQVVPLTTRVSASTPPPEPASNTYRNGEGTATTHQQHRQQQRTNTNHHGLQILVEKPAPENSSRNSQINVVPLPVEDPEEANAKKGLNEWGAFGGGESGGSGTGTFGFGPLLFHHHGIGGRGGGNGGDSGGVSDDEKTQTTSEVSRDPFEMDQLLMGDPISFNPLQAISWATLDEEPLEEDVDAHGVNGGKRRLPSGPTVGIDVESDSYSDYPPDQAARYTSGFQQVSSSHGNFSGHNVGGSPTSTSFTTMMSSEVGQLRRRGTSRNSPYRPTYPADHSSIGNVSQTLSAVTLSPQTPEPTDVYNTSNNKKSVAPAVVPPAPAGRVSEQKVSHGTGSRQQHRERRQRHRQPRETKKNSAHPSVAVPTVPMVSHPYTPNDSYQRQEYAFPPPPPPPFPSSSPSSSSLQPQFHHSSAISQSEVQQYQQPPPPPPPLPPHSAYGTYAITEPYPPPPPPPPGQQQQQSPFLLCLAPNCSARFRCEPELNAHYRTEHAFTCNWASCKSASFTSNNALVWHVKAEHLLLCPVPGCCDRVFATKKALDGHVRVN